MIVYLDMNQQPSARSPLSDLVRAVAFINHLYIYAISKVDVFNLKTVVVGSYS